MEQFDMKQEAKIQLRKMLDQWIEARCPHIGGLEEEPMEKMNCPKCWLALRKGAGLE